MIVSKENGVIAESWLSAQTDAQRALDEAHPDWLPDDHADAVGRLRAGEGPVFVECLTYRLRGHYEGDPGKYRELSELAEWREKDPIVRFETASGQDGSSAEIEAAARVVVDAATEAALAAPEPDAADLLTDVVAA